MTDILMNERENSAGMKPQSQAFINAIRLLNLRIVFSLLALLASSCGKRSELPESYISAQLSVETLTDSTFLSHVQSIVEHRRMIFLDDYKNNRVIQLDSNLKVVRTFGRAGRGPGEFTGASYLQVWRDSIYCIDDAGRRMMVFDSSGVYVRSFSVRTMTRTRFAIDGEGSFYFSTAYTNSAITVFNNSGHETRGFGSWYFQSSNAREKMARNCRHLLMTTKGRIISVGESEPIVELMDSQGMLLKRIDLTKYKYVNSGKNDGVVRQMLGEHCVRGMFCSISGFRI